MPQVPVPSYSTFDYLKKSKRFREIMTEATTIRTQMDDLDRQLATLKEEAEAELMTGGVEIGQTIDYYGWHLRIVDRPGTPRIDKKRLLKLLGADGVQILKKAMVPGKPSHYVALVSPKDKKEEDDDSSGE